MCDEIDNNSKLDTFDEALAYIVDRGIAEITRTRKSHAVSKAKNASIATVKEYKQMFAKHPELATDPRYTAKLMEQLGIFTAAAKAVGAKSKA